MATPDISRFTRDPDLYRTVGTAFLALAGSHGGETEETYADAGAMVDALSFIAALLTEFDPAAGTPRALRQRADAFGSQVGEYAKAIRAENQKRDRPLIMEFGGLRTVEIEGRPPIGR
jgi:hypothetical protein